MFGFATRASHNRAANAAWNSLIIEYVARFSGFASSYLSVFKLPIQLARSCTFLDQISVRRKFMNKSAALRTVLSCAVAFGLAASVISLPGTPAAGARAQSGAALPSAKEVVARYDKALGGEAAIRRHSSSTMRGTIETKEATLSFAD